MTKLQTIEAEIQTLPVDEQRELISKFAYLVTPSEDDYFELTDAELAELDRRMLNVDNEPTFTIEEVFDALEKKYVQSDLA
jgi:hypothetical protein